MASSRTIRIVVKGDTKHATRSLTGFGGLLGGISAKTAALGVGIGGIGAAIVAGKKSFDVYAEFDKIIRQVGVQTNLTGAKLDKLSDLALKLGKDTSFSAKEASDAMLELAKGGLTAAEIKGGVLKQTLTLAAAGGLELGSAATYMTNTLNTFGLGAESARKVAAALAGGANASTASVESLGQALSQVGPGARNAGMSVNETVAALAAFDSAGIKGSDAGTSLKTMLSRLVPSTEKAADKMRTLGLDFTDAQGNFLPMAAVAEQLQNKLGKLSEAERSAALTTIFGSDATRAATVFMNEGSEGINKYIKATKDSNAAQKMAKSNTQGAAGAMEQFGGSMETLQIVIGKAIAPAIVMVTKALTNFTNGAIEWAQQRGPAFAQTLGEIAKALLGGLFRGLKMVGNALSAVMGFFSEHKGLTKALAAVLITLVAVTKAHSVAMAVQAALLKSGGLLGYIKNIRIVQAVTKVWTAVQWALNIAMRANPIGIVITALVALVAGLVYAYKNSKTFRDIVQGAFKAVAAAGKWLWNNVLKPTFDGIVAGLKVLGKFFQWLWENIIRPVFNFIKSAAKVLAAIVGVVILSIVLVIKTLARIVVWLGKKIFGPIFKFIAGIAKWLYANIIQPYFRLIGRAAEVLGRVVKWLGDKIFGPVFGFIADKAKWLWNRVIKPTFDSLKLAGRKVGEAFQSLGRTIGKAWDKVKDAAKKPIEFVIKTVVNKGIIGTFNKLAKAVGVGFRFDPVPMPFRTGGIIPGVPSKQDNTLIAARTGEAVMVPEFARQFGRKGVDQLNRLAERGQNLVNHFPGFKRGGVVYPVGSGGVTQGYHRGHPGIDWGRGRGTNIRSAAGGVVEAVKQWTTSYGRHVRVQHDKGYETLYAHMLRTAVRVGQQVNAGSSLGSVDSTGNSTGNHLHFEVRQNGQQINPANFLAGGVTLGGNVLDDIGDFVKDSFRKVASGAAGLAKWGADKAQAAWDFVSNAAGVVKHFVGGQISKFLPNINAGPFGDVVKAFPHKAVDWVIEKAKSLVSSVSPAVGPGGSGAAKQYAQMLLPRFGWSSPLQWSALNELWRRESNWRWNARNPSSGAYGIPQSLPGSKMASVASDWRTNFRTQVLWGLRYINGRHDSPLGALSFHNRHNWYGDGLEGGIFTKPTLIGVGDGGPERVDVTPLRGRRMSGGTGVTIEGDIYITIPGSQKDAKQLAREIRDELLKLGNRNGGRTGLAPTT